MRAIVFTGARAAHLPALDWLFLQQDRAGSFQPTAVVLEWEGLSFGLGPHEDGDQLSYNGVREAGSSSTRRLAMGGGTAIYEASLSQYVIWYRREDVEDDSLLSRADIEGESNALALRELGFSAGYRSIGDLEVEEQGERLKVGGNGATNLSGTLGSSSTGLIWAPLSTEALGLLGDLIRQPPEKFEDKAVKTFAGRMGALASLGGNGGPRPSQSETTWQCLASSCRALLGEKLDRGELTPDELAVVDEVLPFFEGPAWHYRFSTNALAARAPRDALVGSAAFKRRKLFKASVAVDSSGERILEALITSDAFFAPVGTPVGTGLCEVLSAGIKGCDPRDIAGIEARIAPVLSGAGVDVPLVEPGDVAHAVVRAAQVAKPRDEFLAQSAS